MSKETIPDVVYLDFAPDFVSVSQHAHDEYHGFIRKDLADELARALRAISEDAIGDEGWTSDGHERCTEAAFFALSRYNVATEGK